MAARRERHRRRAGVPALDPPGQRGREAFLGEGVAVLEELPQVAGQRNREREIIPEEPGGAGVRLALSWASSPRGSACNADKTANHLNVHAVVSLAEL